MKKQLIFFILSLVYSSIINTLYAQKNNTSIKEFYVETIKNQNFKMIYVEGGTFKMGQSTYKNQGKGISVDFSENDEKPIHQVNLNNYYISEAEVTNALWRIIMGSVPNNSTCEQCPVRNISWDNIQVFLSKLNRLTSKNYRLPTEAEWEYAAIGGRKSQGYKYSGSDDLDVVGWGYYEKISPIKSKKPNELELYDMTGNVWEWCQDWYGENFYASKEATNNNPINQQSGTYRVVRGGSVNSNLEEARVTNREKFIPNKTYEDIGFRIVLAQ